MNNQLKSTKKIPNKITNKKLTLKENKGAD